MPEYHNLICMFESYFKKDTSNMQSDTIILPALFVLWMLKMVYLLWLLSSNIFFFLSKTQSITSAVSKRSAHWNDGYLNIHHLASSKICFLLYFTATWQSRWRYFLCLHNLWNVLISICCFPMELVKNLSLSLPLTFINEGGE